MGREIRQVALDFEWPLNKVWKGFINPYPLGDCKWCGGTGRTEYGNTLQDEWYDRGWSHNLSQEDIDALLSANRLWDFTRVPINDEQREIVKEKIKNGGNSWLPFNNGYRPTPEEVNKWSRIGFGHDSLNSYICISARAKREKKRLYCTKCRGHAYKFQNRKIKKKYKNWKDYDPPKGPGYQLWETTSEGSPISPVLKTPEELAFWLEKNKASSFGSETCTYDQWLKFIKGPARALSAVSGPNGLGLHSGVAEAARMEEKPKYSIGEKVILHGLEDYFMFNGEIVEITAIKKGAPNGIAYYFETDNEELKNELDWIYEYRMVRPEEVVTHKRTN